MKKIEKTTTIYQALDGKEFVSKSDCENYEAEKYKDINLWHFDFAVPYGDDGLYYWTAYKVNSENEFDMLMAYLKYNNDDLYGIEKYAGAGWYAVQFHVDSVWADVKLLSQVVKDFTNMLANIAEKTMDFEEE